MRGALGGALVLASLAMPLAAGARPPGSRGPSVTRHLEQLGLDADTRAAVQQILDESESQEQALRERKRQTRERMHELLSRPTMDRDAVMRQAEALDALHAELHRIRLDAILRIHERLTPAQREELVRIRERERGKHGRRGFHGPLGRCTGDVRRLCAEAADGRAALGCLANRWEELDDSCREAFAESREPEPEPRPDAAPP
jgi:Spy/CpxP family protein refolding chaperone